MLRCEFHNPGHGSGTDGLIVPARPTATYAVTVDWPVDGWTISGADGDGYSARDLCPRGGDGGHEEGGGHEAGGEEGGDERVAKRVAAMKKAVKQATKVVPTTKVARFPACTRS